jgi:hypothetical protein
MPMGVVAKLGVRMGGAMIEDLEDGFGSIFSVPFDCLAARELSATTKVTSTGQA